MAVVYPLESRMQQTKSRAKRIIFVVWIIPCCIASPFLYPSEAFSNTLHSPYGTITRLSCFISLPETFRKGYYTFLFAFVYILPLSFIAGTCFRVARCLLKDIPVHRQGSIRRQEANRRKVAKMVLMVVIAFAVSWTPYFLVSIITQYQAVNFMERHNFFFTMLSINLFAFLNSCVNPFIYAAMSSRFRNGFFRFFRFLCLFGFCSSNEDSERIVNVNPSVSIPGHVEKRVRFRCKANMSCLITQSSSDSGSCVQSESSQRTACTLDLKNGCMIKSLLKKRSSQKIVVQYIKRNEEIKVTDKLPEEMKTLPTTNLTFMFKPSKSLKKFRSISDDLSLLYDDTQTDFSSRCPRKWFSCIDINSHDRCIL